MSMTSEEIAAAIGELSGALEGAFPHKIFQPGREEWIIETRKGGDRLWLLISVSARNGRVHLVKEAPGDCPPMEGFARTLKKILLRRKILSIRQVGGDRVVHIHFGGGGGEMTLAVEIMGTAGNVYLLDHEGKVGAMALAKKGRAEPGSVYAPPPAPQGKSPMKAPPPLEIIGGEAFPINFAMERRCQAAATEEKLAYAKSGLTASLREELKKITRRRQNMETELTALRSWAECGKLGDLIKANYHLIPKGADKVEVDNLFSPEMERIVIPLDPAKSAEKNAEAYYKKRHKYDKGVPRIGAELADLSAREADIRARIEKINSIGSMKDMAPFLPKDEEREEKPAKGAATGKKAKSKVQPAGPKRFINSEGHTILVGRNDQENDELTFKIANGRDLWLHARDYPGSHVLVRLPKGVEPSRKTIEEAAMIALHYSKAAKAGKGEVTWCLAKNVKKPKGAPPGKAQVHGAKSVSVRINEAAIKAMKSD